MVDEINAQIEKSIRLSEGMKSQIGATRMKKRSNNLSEDDSLGGGSGPGSTIWTLFSFRLYFYCCYMASVCLLCPNCLEEPVS